MNRATSASRDGTPKLFDSLEGLRPLERAVYVLHWVFDYSQSDVANALNLTEVAVEDAFERAVEWLMHGLDGRRP